MIDDPRDELSMTLYGRKRSESIEQGICVKCGNRIEHATQHYLTTGICMECDRIALGPGLAHPRIDVKIMTVRNFFERLTIEGATEDQKSQGIGGMLACDFIDLAMNVKTVNEIIDQLNEILSGLNENMTLN